MELERMNSEVQMMHEIPTLYNGISTVHDGGKWKGDCLGRGTDFTTIWLLILTCKKLPAIGYVQINSK